MTSEEQLSALQTELKSYVEKAAEERKNYGTTLETTNTALSAIQKQVDAIDVKLAEKHTAQAAQTPGCLERAFKENESVQRMMRDQRGSAVVQLKAAEIRELERKNVITSTTTGSIGTDTGSAVGQATSGILQIDRIPGIVPEARQILKVRDLLSARPTTMQVVDFVKVSTPMSIASPTVEASVKPENTLAFTSVSEKVRLIATWIPATRQVLSDFVELNGFINSTLPYYVNLAEEIQLLSGDSTGENLHGLITQATAFSTGLLSSTAGWNKIDIVGRAIQQITAAKEIDPTFIIVHPNDWWSMRLQKDGFGRYILGDPQTNTRPSLFGLDVVYTTSIQSGTFLTGSGNPIAAEIRDRLEMVVELSTEHSDYFIRNMIAIRAEKRMALIVKRPASFISGTFTTSP